jgi:dihydrofolate reductase
MIISIIAAIAQNGIVGKNGTMPWKIPEEMKFFKEKTTNHPIIMGRKTWDSLYSKPLKNRYNII